MAALCGLDRHVLLLTYEPPQQWIADTSMLLEPTDIMHLSGLRTRCPHRASVHGYRLVTRNSEVTHKLLLQSKADQVY